MPTSQKERGRFVPDALIVHRSPVDGVFEPIRGTAQHDERYRRLEKPSQHRVAAAHHREQDAVDMSSRQVVPKEGFLLVVLGNADQKVKAVFLKLLGEGLYADSEVGIFEQLLMFFGYHICN